MKKIIAMLMAVAIIAPVAFAQVKVTATNEFSAEFGNERASDPLPLDKLKDNDSTVLKKLRENFEIRVTGEKFDFWYRARFNMHEMSSGMSSSNMVAALVPGSGGGGSGGESQANLWIMPSSIINLGVGTDLGVDVGLYCSVLDDRFYHITKIFRRDGKEIGDKPITAAAKGFALKVMPIDGLMLIANIPFQNFNFTDSTNPPRDGSDLKMNWGAKYTKDGVFSAGASYVGSFNGADNPWGLFAGVSLPVIPFVKPDIFFQMRAIGSNAIAKAGDYITSTYVDYNSTDIGIRLNMDFGALSIKPEFNISFVSFNKTTKDDYSASSGSDDNIMDDYTNPMLVGLPVYYKINETLTAGAMFAFSTGHQKRDADGYNTPWRLTIHPEVICKTGIGEFAAKVGVTIDNTYTDFEFRNTRYTAKNETRIGYIAEFVWKAMLF